MYLYIYKIYRVIFFLRSIKKLKIRVCENIKYDQQNIYYYELHRFDFDCHVTYQLRLFNGINCRMTLYYSKGKYYIP